LVYSFDNYLADWIEFHLLYRLYSRRSCTPLLEVMYEKMADQNVRQSTLADVLRRLNFTTTPSDLQLSAQKNDLLLNSVEARLAVAPEEMCFAFKRHHVEQPPTLWPEFSPNSLPGWESDERSAMMRDYDLTHFHRDFRETFHRLCGKFGPDGTLKLVPQEDHGVSPDDSERMRARAAADQQSDYLSCGEIRRVQSGRERIKSATGSSIKGKTKTQR